MINSTKCLPAKLATLVFTASFCSPAFAQLPTADLSRIYPFYCRAGEQVNVEAIGKNLEDLTELRFTHPGIVAQPKMLPPDEFHPLERMDGNRFDVSVAADVPPGIYEARAVGFYGYSTAKAFVVASASANEVFEPRRHCTRDEALSIEVGSTVSSIVDSRGIDWYRFHAKADQRVLVELFAERIDSRLDGLIVLYDEAGRELQRNRDWFGRDSFLEIAPQRDGEFFLAVSDILYRGGSEYFYRLNVSRRPHIDFVFPPAGEPGSKKTYKVFGRNLPGGSLGDLVYRQGKQLESIEVEIQLPDVPSVPTNFFPGTPRQSLLPSYDFKIGDSNSVRIGFATAPVQIEDANEKQHSVVVPIEIAGRFDEADYEDSYRFSAAKGKTYCIEVIADRMQSQVDPHLIVSRVNKTDAGETLTQVAENDDKRSYFAVAGTTSMNADTSDAYVTLVADADADYVITIVNQFGTGDAASLYRLAIREPLHDFALLASTERPLPTNRTGYSVTPHLRAGARWGIRIIAPRQDGFEGDIDVKAEGLPKGVTGKTLRLSGKTDEGLLILTAANNVDAWSGDIKIVGRAKIGDRVVVREAKFTTIVWGHIFADSIRVRSRPTVSVPLSVNASEKAPIVFGPAEDKQWTVEVGKKLEIPVRIMDNGSRTGSVTIEPFGLYGMHRNPPKLNIAEDQTDGTLSINFAKNGNFDVTPGFYQFALHCTGTAKYRHNVPANIRTGAERRRIRELVADLESSGASAERIKQAKAAQESIDKIAKAAGAMAVEKNEKFSAWSELITVNVVGSGP